jgi:hypothetical protein
MAAAKNVPSILATGSKYRPDVPIYADPRDVSEIPNLEILPMPYRFHSSMDDGKPDGLPRDLRKGKFDKSKGYFTVRCIDPATAPRRKPPDLDLSSNSPSFSSSGLSRRASSGLSPRTHGNCQNAIRASVRRRRRPQTPAEGYVD